MSEISVYDIVPTPKLADKLIGTSVGGVIPDVTYNFTLEELLQLFIPNIPANTLQGVLDYGNTATQNINLTGTISTTNLSVLATANILNSNLSGNTRVMAGLFDRTNASGTAGQVLRSTGTQVEWYTVPTVIPTLQQVLTSGNTADRDIILTANITAVTATATNVVSNTALSVNGVLRDGTAAAGGSNQILSSTGIGVRWVDMPVYNVISPLLYDTPTKTFSIQVANGSQNGYLSSADWINFDGKQNPILLTTTGTSGAATFVGNTLNIPIYTPDLSGYVPTSRTLTINGVTYDLSANRSWTIPAGVAEVTATSPLFSTGGAYPDISIQVANTSQSGYLTNTDWNTFNAKQGALTLTTTGTSGAATLVGATLNIPQYQSVLTNPITGLGTVNYVPKFNTTSSIANSNIQDSGTLITLGSNTTISSGALGIGTTSLTGYNLRVSKNITGATTAYGISVDGVIQSDVTAQGRGYYSNLSTAASAFTLFALTHFHAEQATIGSGSTVTTQTGFLANSTLIGATNNYGFRGLIASGSNRFNLYLDGTANNHMAGSLGIGTTLLTNTNLRVSKNITGSNISLGIYQNGTIQSDVTSFAYGFYNSASTAAASFTNLNYLHFAATQGTIGAGSAITNQYGFSVDNTLIGATNNYGFRGAISSASGRWNLFMDGTAQNYLAGALGIGVTNPSPSSLVIAKTLTGAVSLSGVVQYGTVQSDATTSVFGFRNDLYTQATTFTLTDYNHFIATQQTIGASSVVTNQYGYFAQGTLIGATNNYGFYGAIPSGANRWNLYMGGTANNYLAGNLLLNTTTDSGFRLDVFGTTRFNGTTASDTAPLGAELAGVTGTGTGWTLVGTNLNVGGYNHTPGDTTPLTTTLAAVIGTYYQITYTITNRTAGSVSISYGGASVTSTTTGAIGPIALSTAPLVITPTTDFDGNVVISIKSIGISSASSTFSTSTGGSRLEFRATTAGANTIIGTSSGRRITTGSNNTFLGASAGANHTTGSNNVFIGVSAGAAQTTASSNTFIGYGAGDATTTGSSNTFLGINSGSNNTTGTLNIFIGVQAGDLNTTGSNNVAIGQLALSSANVTGSTAVGHNSLRDSTGINNAAFGYQTFLGLVAGANNTSIGNLAGRYFGGSTLNALTQADNTTLVGQNAMPLANAQTNQIVIGYSAVGLGSNTTVLGNTSTTLTALYGAVITGGTSINASAQLQVDSTTKGFLPPRMTAAQRAAIASPAEGLIVFQTDGTIGLYVYANAVWRTLAMV